MRRSVVLTALLAPAAFAAAVVAGPASAGDPACPVVDGTVIAQAPEGTSSLRVALGAEVTVIADDVVFCRVSAENVVGAQLSDLDGAVTFWGFNYPGALPGPIDVANDAGDDVNVNASGGAESITSSAPGRLRVDDGRGVTRLRFAAVPEALTLRTQGGRDLVDLTTGAGWAGDVVVDASHGVGRAAARHATVEDMVVRLGAGDDTVLLVDGADVVATGAGRDVVRTMGGADRVSLGAGADTVDAGAGRDRVAGGKGADRLRVKDGRRDVVDGGGGRDAAQRDGVDQVTSVEGRLR